MDSANTSKIPESKIWYYNLYCTLVKKHQVIRPDFSVQDQHLHTVHNLKDNRKKHQDIFSDKLLRHVRAENEKSKIDLFFSYFYNDVINPEVIVEIKKLGILTVNFYCNSIHQFDNVALIAPLYDYSMFPEKDAFIKYKNAGAYPIHIQMAANPDFYKPYNLVKKFDSTFTAPWTVTPANLSTGSSIAGLSPALEKFPGWKRSEQCKQAMSWC